MAQKYKIMLFVNMEFDKLAIAHIKHLSILNAQKFFDGKETYQAQNSTEKESEKAVFCHDQV
jgi:hypothetical protein